MNIFEDERKLGTGQRLWSSVSGGLVSLFVLVRAKMFFGFLLIVGILVAIFTIYKFCKFVKRYDVSNKYYGVKQAYLTTQKSKPQPQPRRSTHYNNAPSLFSWKKERSEPVVVSLDIMHNRIILF